MDEKPPSSDQGSTESQDPTRSPRAQKSPSQKAAQRLSSASSETILESFGHDKNGFTCRDCGRHRTYFDLLSGGVLVCLECSYKNDYQLDEHVSRSVRDTGLLSSDPELVEIKKALVEYELSKNSVKIKASIPKELHDRIKALMASEKTTLDVLVTSALSTLVRK